MSRPYFERLTAYSRKMRSDRDWQEQLAAREATQPEPDRRNAPAQGLSIYEQATENLNRLNRRLQENTAVSQAVNNSTQLP